MQLPGGAIGWALRPDGTPDDTALLTGNASLFQALRCGIALAGLRGEAQPDWELAVTDLGTALRPGPRPSPTGPASRWTGTTRCSAGAVTGIDAGTSGWPPTGTGSSSPGWAPGAWPTGPG